MPAKKTAKTAKAPKAAKKPAKMFVFFNCDGEKSRKSMNIFYNNEVYKDTIASRKKLWAKVNEEIEAGRVQIDETNLAKAEEAVTGGNPCEASQYLRYGQIEALICH